MSVTVKEILDICDQVIAEGEEYVSIQLPPSFSPQTIRMVGLIMIPNRNGWTLKAKASDLKEKLLQEKQHVMKL